MEPMHGVRGGVHRVDATKGCCGSRCSSGSGTTSGRRSACGEERPDGRRAPSDGRREPEPADESRRAPRRRMTTSSAVRAHQPQEGLLARGRLHQGRPDRVLPRRLALAARLSPEPAGRDDPLSRRHRRQVVLPEGRARLPPDWIRTERMWSEDTQREIDYFVCDDEASLLYVVNLGSIPLHLWASRVADARAARLVRARSRSQGRAVRARGRGRARAARSSATRSDCRCW